MSSSPPYCLRHNSSRSVIPKWRRGVLPWLYPALELFRLQNKLLHGTMPEQTEWQNNNNNNKKKTKKQQLVDKKRSYSALPPICTKIKNKVDKMSTPGYIITLFVTCLMFHRRWSVSRVDNYHWVLLLLSSVIVCYFLYQDILQRVFLIQIVTDLTRRSKTPELRENPRFNYFNERSDLKFQKRKSFVDKYIYIYIVKSCLQYKRTMPSGGIITAGGIGCRGFVFRLRLACLNITPVCRWFSLGIPVTSTLCRKGLLVYETCWCPFN